MANILHIIPRMVQGGAEQLLLDYFRSEHTEHEHKALILFSDSDQRMIEPIIGRVEQRASSSYSGIARDILAIRRQIARERPAVVVAWMYHASVLAPALVPRGIPVLSYLHNTDLSAQAKRAERIAQKALSRISTSLRVSLLYSGIASRTFHEGSLGYPAVRAHVLSNAISLDTFAADASRRSATREALGIPPDAFVFGCFGRFNPQKNWPLVLDAVSAARSENVNVRLIATGRGVNMDNTDFAVLVEERGLQPHVIALDAQSNMSRFYDAIDVLLMGSRYGEAMPLVLLETLAMGKPAIATKLGSIPDILEGLWDPIPVDSPHLFVATAVEAARGEWAGQGISSEVLRERAVNRYGMHSYVKGLDQILTDLCKCPTIV